MNANNEADGKVFMLDGQKLIADTISVPLSKDELKLLIDGLCEMPLTNKLALNMHQKLAKKLNALENSNEAR